MNHKRYIINVKLKPDTHGKGVCRLCPNNSRVERGAHPPGHESCKAQRTPVPRTERSLAGKVAHGRTCSSEFIS